MCFSCTLTTPPGYLRADVIEFSAMNQPIKMILASNSPRRRELLGLFDRHFDVLPADVDEAVLPGEAPPKYVQRLADSKARFVGAQIGTVALVVAADTTVVDGAPDGGFEILGKPIDAADAERMLRQLRGRAHRVYTALAVLRTSDGRMETDICCTDVPMRDYSDAEMLDYIASGDPLDKAGAYAIQHAGFRPAEVNQCYANVVGFPLCHFTRLLRKFDLEPEVDIPLTCQQQFEYSCPVFDSILRE